MAESESSDEQSEVVRATQRGIVPGGARVDGDRNLGYGAIHPFALPGWDPPETIHVRGPNWQVIFISDEVGYVKAARGGETEARELSGPAVFIASSGGMSDAAQAADVQRPLVETIRGLLFMMGPPGSPIFTPAVWEGVFKKDKPDKITFEDRWSEARSNGPISRDKIDAWGRKWGWVDPNSLKPELTFALRWYAKAMRELLTPPAGEVDAFVSFWIATIVIVRSWYAENVGGDPSEVDRFEPYAIRRMGVPESQVDEKVNLFRTVYRRRNNLLKGGGGMAVVAAELDAAAQLAYQALEVELWTLAPPLDR